LFAGVTSATATSAAGTTYMIAPVLADPNNKLSNYSVSSTNGTLTVTAAPLTVSVINQTRLFGVANSTLTGSISGVVGQDGITATYSTVAAPTSPVGTYPIVSTLVDPNNRLSNYAVTNAPGTLDVNYYQLTAPATLSIAQGKVGTATITMTPLNGFTGTVTFSCGPLPVATTCSFTQPQLTGNLQNKPVSTSVVITTTGRNGTIAGHRNSTNPLKPWYGAMGISAFGIMLWGGKRKRLVIAGLLVMMTFTIMVSMTGCGKGITQTPLGATNLIVNATVSGGSAQNVAPNQQVQIAVTVTP